MSGAHEEDLNLIEDARARAAACAKVLDTANAYLFVRLADSMELLLSELSVMRSELFTTRARLVGTTEAIPTLVVSARTRAFDEAADAFGELSWQCLDHGGEEVAKIRSMVYEARDRRPPKGEEP
jgi:hypothetical protein